MEDARLAPQDANAPLRLTPLDTAQAALRALIPCPVSPRAMILTAAASGGGVLACDLAAPAALPRAAAARRDGWAVAAEDTLGASPYSPAPLVGRPTRIAIGEMLPPGTDAVLAPFDLDAEAGFAQALQAVTPGDGVRAVGEDAEAGALLRAAGERLRPQDIAALAAFGIATVAMRQARVAWIPVGDELVLAPLQDRLGAMATAVAARDGAALTRASPVADSPAAIAAALRTAAGSGDHDLLLLVGGTGDGPDDRSAAGVSAAGRLAIHGIGMRPGMRAGIGACDGKPILMLPGSVEDALAAWILLVRPALAALTGAAPPPTWRVRLTRKIASTVGLAELALLSTANAAEVTPLAIGDLPLRAWLAADRVLLVPAAAEGHEAGSEVVVGPLWWSA
jgi:molybdopterin biosynthesis enzyme